MIISNYTIFPKKKFTCIAKTKKIERRFLASETYYILCFVHFKYNYNNDVLRLLLITVKYVHFQVQMDKIFWVFWRQLLFLVQKV